MIRYFDIFAGIGGFRSGLEKAGGFECVGYCEIDKYAKKAYETLYDTENQAHHQKIPDLTSGFRTTGAQKNVCLPMRPSTR